MNQKSLEERLTNLQLGGIRYFEKIGSTNDEAADWAARGAPDFGLVIADEQTAGRGRGDRKWFTYPKSALAFSLILQPSKLEEEASAEIVPRYVGLGALGVCQALAQRYRLHANIKWPNDVLLGDRKCCGVLAESQWNGNQLSTVILGIGINVAPSSVPPDDTLFYPATCVETALSDMVDRINLLRAVLAEIIHWRSKLMTDAFIKTWNAKLAFKDKWVQIVSAEHKLKLRHEGRLVGLSSDGALRLQTKSGNEVTLWSGEILQDGTQIHLRPVDSSSK